MNEQIVELLRELAAQLNTTVEFLWEVLIRQAQVYVISHIIYWLLFAVLFVPAIWISKKFMEVVNEGDTDNDNRLIWVFMVALTLWIFIIILGIENLWAIEEFLTALLNPEYWALQQILNQIQ